MAADTSIVGRLKTFASTNGITLLAKHKDYEGLGQFKSGMEVPMCFEGFDSRAPLCKQCPIRVDCMTASSQ